MMDIIILSGGLGTRLKDVINDIPKTMAPINGKPFLEYRLDYLKKYDIKNIILAVGYKKEYIKNIIGDNYKGINIIYSEENEQLGTGGAIKKALEKTNEKNVIVMNGDIYANVNLEEMLKEHVDSKAVMTLALKKMRNFDRFGVVEFDDNNIITEFKEKRFMEIGYINVGIYVVNKNLFQGLNFGNKFSIEDEYLSKFTKTRKHKAYIYDGEFIDIGIPEDYKKIQELLRGD